jgi:hypothetical protein
MNHPEIIVFLQEKYNLAKLALPTKVEQIMLGRPNQAMNHNHPKKSVLTDEEIENWKRTEETMKSQLLVRYERTLMETKNLAEWIVAYLREHRSQNIFMTHSEMLDYVRYFQLYYTTISDSDVVDKFFGISF